MERRFAAMTARAAARKRSRPERPESDRALPSELERESSRKSFWLAARVVGCRGVRGRYEGADVLCVGALAEQRNSYSSCRAILRGHIYNSDGLKRPCLCSEKHILDT